MDNFIEKCETKLIDKFKAIDDIAYFNQVKVLNAFKDCRVSLRHFNPTTGYGYDDEGRDTLGKLYAK
ncbi:MAG: methionine gamma-lyase family protein, partial [Clostridia bacterium]|nr:methionine gamma-lyase family protein [Clostridia bacterium]